MPELPEVETVASELKRKITGRRVMRLLSRSDKLERADADRLKGREVLQVSRRAKLIRIKFTGGLSVLVHLKMTGRLFFIKKGGREIKTPHVRAVFEFSDGTKLVFEDVRKFGYIKVVKDEEAEKIIESFGPEPLLRTFTLSSLKEILARHKKTKIKPLLMDQRRIAGVGNIYADEILFKAKVHPLKKSGALSAGKIKELHRAIKFILKKAVRLKGSSIESYLRTGGEAGEYDRVRYVYQKEGQPCPRCGGKIKKIRVGGRGTYFCPNCQVL